MKKGTVRYTIASVISIILFVLVAIYSYTNRMTENTDVIITSQYFVEGMTSWFVLIPALIAEIAVVKWFMKESYLKSTAIALVMNIVSAILGFVTIHIVAFVVELLFIFIPVGSFHVSHWIADMLAIVLMNTCLEGLAVKIGFKYKFKKMFKWLLLANLISMIICFLLNLSWIGEMFFTF